MASLVLFKPFLVLFTGIISSAICQDMLYGTRMPMISSPGLTGPTGTIAAATGSSGRSNPSTGMMSGLTSRGRVVSNSILDLEDWSTAENMDNESMRPSGFDQAMTRPIMTGPSVVSGKMLVTDSESGYNQMTVMGDRSRGTNPTISTNPRNEGQNKAYRFVSVHVPPEPVMVPVPQRPQTTPKPSETHYQIIFIKAPTTSVPQEIQMPAQPKLKTLVYVLLKKPEMNDFVKISQPPKAKPSKPEVFFIQYKGDKSQQPMMTTGSSNGDLSNTVPQVSKQPRLPGNLMMMTTTSAGNNLGNTNNMANNEPISRPRERPNTSTTGRPLSPSGMGMSQNVGGYGNPEIADSDFSHDSFNQNEYQLSSYQRHNVNQNQLRSGFSYSSPVTSHYGIVS